MFANKAIAESAKELVLQKELEGIQMTEEAQ
jgi:hypothetical protein